MDAILAAIDAAVEANRRASAPPQAPPQKRPRSSHPKHTQPVARQAPPEEATPDRNEREALSDLHGWEPRGPTGALAGLFEDGNSLVRAVIASEVLGLPAALRERPLWSPRPNEPST